ncbi:MAG: amino-acid N-acetyltransferase [Gammaproteobacteria bacterium]
MTEQLLPICSGAAAAMREASPYIRTHRGETFVVYVGGEALSEWGFAGLVQDLILLRGLGVKLIVVHGARPQIDVKVANSGIEQEFVGDLRVTDSNTLACAKDAIAAVRIEFEARLSQSAVDIPRRGLAIAVSGGNFVTARPVGVVTGVDLHFTGEVRCIDLDAIQRRLDGGELVLISPLGFSPTGEVFNLNSLDLASAVACEIKASKLILMMDSPGITDSEGSVARQLTVGEARGFCASGPVPNRFLACAIGACELGVERVHLIDRELEGVLIDELFTRDGVGTLVSDTPFDRIRLATIEDVGGILALIGPLERDGSLVKRSREKLEIEIECFSVLVREGVVVACGALYTLANDLGEIACLAVHPDYRRDGFGNLVLGALEHRASTAGLQQVFALTTQATHWFLENGYVRIEISDLPVERRAMYNYQRNSIVLSKRL